MMIKLSWSLFLSELFLLFLLSSADTFSAPVYNECRRERVNLEAQPWSSSGLYRATKTSSCATNYWLGGPSALNPGGYFVSQWDDLPPHDIIYVSMRFVLTGTWSANDKFSLNFDSKAISVEKINLLSSLFTNSACDGATRSSLALYTMSARVFHTGSSLNLKMLSELITGPALANFGVRTMCLLFANKTASETETFCFRNRVSVIAQAHPNKCTCALGQYPNPSNPAQCLTCNPSCWDCFGPALSQCYRCNTGYSYVNGICILCDTSCNQCSGSNSDQCTSCKTGLWLYWNNSCKSTCTSPVASQLVYDDIRLCNLPCPEGQYMLWDNTCVYDCDFPLKIVKNSTGNYCNKPCDANKYFFIEDSSCIDTCNGYYMGIVEFGVDYCVWKCDSDQYMLWDITCVDSCDYPLVEESNSTGVFCLKPCDDGEFFYKNGSCFDSCDLPFEAGVVLDVDTCFWKCDAGGQYMRWDYSCWNSCDDPLEIVTNSTGKFCFKPCQDGEFFYANGSCIDSCDLPFEAGVTLDVDTCYWKCDSDQYMRWDYTCWDSCDYPLKIRANSTGKFCFKPCEDGEFFYKNGSCFDSCDLPFETGLTLDVDTCYWKCDSDQYMRWDSTCWDSCDKPLKIRANSTGNFCFKPCEDGEFSYSNGSCIDSCDFPFEPRTALGIVDTCLFKCDSNEFLSAKNGSCMARCEFPLMVRSGKGSEGKFCESPCKSDEFILADRSCSKTCASPQYYDGVKVCLESEEYDNEAIRLLAKIIKTEGQISFGLMMALSLGKMGSSNSLCLASLAKMLEYVKYMKINYSQKLELLFQLQGSSELSLSFEVPLSEGIQEKFPDHELPWNFEDYELNSSFFLNYWETLGTILVILAGILGLLLLTAITKGKMYHNVFPWLKAVFKWNFLLMIFCSNFEGVVFFTSLEMRTLDFNSFTGILSFLTCIVANIFAVAVLGRIVFILKDIRKLKYRQVHDISSFREGEKKINPHRKWKSYQVLFLHCNEEKSIQQAFFVIFLVRVYFFHLTIGYIFPAPLIQSVIITILSVLMLTYLITQRPLEEKWDFIKMIITELIVFTVNLCVLVLAVLDHNGKQTEEFLSFIIIIANVVFNTLVMIFLGIESFLAVVKIYKEIKAHKLKGINSLLEIFMMIFAGEAMAMEDEYLTPDAEESEKTSVKQKPRMIELETPQANYEKNGNSVISELLKFQSPKSPRSSLFDEERLSGKVRLNLVRHNKKVSESAFKFDVSSFKELEGNIKPSKILRHEDGSVVLLTPPKVVDGQVPLHSLKIESENELKASLAKIDSAGENLKLLSEN